MAEAEYTPFLTEPDAKPVRLIVRRVGPTPGSQLALFASYSYHAFITDRDGDTLELEADHRRHAGTENAIRDLKYGVVPNHLPAGHFGHFAANAAWQAFQVTAHNMARWTGRIALGEPVATTKTLRRRFFSLAGRLTPIGPPPQPASGTGLARGKTSSAPPWPGCGHCPYPPGGAVAVWLVSKATQPPRRPAQVEPRVSPAASWPPVSPPLVLRAVRNPLPVIAAPVNRPHLSASSPAISFPPLLPPVSPSRSQSLRWIQPMLNSETRWRSRSPLQYTIGTAKRIGRERRNAGRTPTERAHRQRHQQADQLGWLAGP